MSYNVVNVTYINTCRIMQYMLEKDTHVTDSNMSKKRTINVTYCIILHVDRNHVISF